MLRHRMMRLTDGARCKQGRWQGWREFTVAQIERHATQVLSFTLRPRDNGKLAEYRAGQFLTLRLKTSSGDVCTRTWSLSDYVEGGDAYRLTIRRASGAGSTHMHDHIKVGDILEARSPSGAFTLDRSTPFRVTLISAGIGVTPLLSMLKAHQQRKDAPPVLWIHSTRDGATHALRDEVNRIVQSGPACRAHIVYSSPRAADRLGSDYHAAGRLTPARLHRLLGGTYRCRPFGREIELPSQAGVFYICGPEGFEQLARQALLQFCVEPAAILSERFGRSSSPPATGLSSCEVRFARSAVTAVWSSDLDCSLLEVAEQQGIEASFGCRAGSCHSCATALTAGKIRYELQPAAEPAPGHVLLCCARPDSPTVELDL